MVIGCCGTLLGIFVAKKSKCDFLIIWMKKCCALQSKIIHNAHGIEKISCPIYEHHWGLKLNVDKKSKKLNKRSPTQIMLDQWGEKSENFDLT